MRYGKFAQALIICWFFAFFVTLGCGVPKIGQAPKRDFVLEDLLITERALKDGTWFRWEPTDAYIRRSWGDDKLGKTVTVIRLDHPQEYVFSHAVLPFEYFSYANEEYELHASGGVGIFVETPIEKLLTSASAVFVTQRAQRYYAGCDDDEGQGESTCTFNAQYDEYVSFLHARIRPETISFDDFNELMKEVDRIMVEHLGATRPDGSTEPAQNELTMWLEKIRAEDMERSTPEPLLDYLLFPWNQTLIQPASPLFTPAGEVQATSTP